MNTDTQEIQLPLPPAKSMRSEMEIYARFMGHLRHVPHRRMEIKILSAIQFTADMMDYTDAQVAKVLVDRGLRAGRMAFPAAYLSFADAALMRNPWDVGGPNMALQELRDHWFVSGEDKFSAFRGEYRVLDDAIGAACV